ncbi:archaetidylserine decarboxylase [Candidatus Westeberhardia cardiocondylae]|nr:archaetidylserine decarboxylase [Candidatus Westeberhardia cardiocondylae]
MEEAQQSDISSYLTFNDFFTRSLRVDARPINHDPGKLIFPADGKILQFGSINEGYLLQAKGHYYTLEALLAKNNSEIEYFKNGNFITTYLSPGDYHRIHMPCDGILQEMIYIPGELFSISKLTTTNIPNLFTRNERLVCLFNTNFGIMAQILVGATIVGNIETIWEKNIIPSQNKIIKHWEYSKNKNSNITKLSKGQEMGRFRLGSTVINIFSNQKIQFNQQLHINYITRVGQYLAKGIQK